jgi:peptidoglycan hydrolase-like amidase
VGMSQAAAITLAEGGMTVDEILARFYPGTDIK